MRRTSFVALLVVGAMLIPLGVFASHQFNDVPDSHTFHNAIDWMKDNNITVGCNPPANTNYCPNNNVTRGEMAAFMKRLAENNVVDAATLDGKDSTALQTVVSGASEDYYTGVNRSFTAYIKVLDLTVQAPVAGTSVVSGTVSAYFSGAVSRYAAWVQLDNGTCDNYQEAIGGARGWETLGANPVDLTYATVSFNAAVALPAGSHVLTLCAQSLEGANMTLIDGSVTSAFSAGGSVVAPTGDIAGGGVDPGR